MKTGALIALLLPFTAAAQVVCALGSGAASYNAYMDQRPSADAMQLVGRAYTAAKNICGSNCPEVVLFRNVTASNLMLITDHQRAKIVYDPKIITTVYDRHGDAGIIGLMSHALGHALDDTLGAAWIEKGWNPELRADAWSGCILAKSNLKPTEFAAALAALSDYPSPAHPAWNLRLPPIRSGYTHCGGAPPTGH
jgi:hypothetical protein